MLRVKYPRRQPRGCCGARAEPRCRPWTSPRMHNRVFPLECTAPASPRRSRSLRLPGPDTEGPARLPRPQDSIQASSMAFARGRVARSVAKPSRAASKWGRRDSNPRTPDVSGALPLSYVPQNGRRWPPPPVLLHHQGPAATLSRSVHTILGSRAPIPRPSWYWRVAPHSSPRGARAGVSCRSSGRCTRTVGPARRGEEGSRTPQQ